MSRTASWNTGWLTHVACKGGAPAVQDLIAGHIDLMLDVSPSSIPLVREGEVHALGRGDPRCRGAA